MSASGGGGSGGSGGGGGGGGFIHSQILMKFPFRVWARGGC